MFRFGKIIFLVFCLSFLASKAQAADFYVAKSGNNDNTCLSEETPCLTIQGAIDKSSNNDTVRVAVGTYEEDLTIDKTLSLKGANAGTPLGTLPGPRGAETVIIGEGVVSQPGVSIDGFSFKRPEVNAAQIVKIIRASGGGSLEILNNSFDLSLAPEYTNPSCGSALSGNADMIVSGSSFANQVWFFGGECANDPEGSRIESQMIYLNEAGSLQLSRSTFQNVERGAYLVGAGKSSVLDNRFTGNTSQGVYAGSNNLEIKGNTFAGLGGIWLEGASGVIIKNNLFAEESELAIYARGNFSATIRENAFLGSVREEIPFDPPIPVGISVEHISDSSSLNLYYNYWPDLDNISSRIRSSGSAPVFFDTQINNYAPDDTRLGGSGFWPLVRSYQWDVNPLRGLERNFESFFTGKSLKVTLSGEVSGKAILEAYDMGNPQSQPYPRALGNLSLGESPIYYSLIPAAGSSFSSVNKARVCTKIPEGSFPIFINPKIYFYNEGWKEGLNQGLEGENFCADVDNVSAMILAHPAILPNNVTRPSIRGKSRIGERVEAVPGSWNSFPGEITSYAYQWQRRLTKDGPWQDISGETGNNYRFSDRDVGRYVRLRVRAENGQGEQFAFSGDRFIQKSKDALKLRRVAKSVGVPATQKVLFARLSCLEGYCSLREKKAFFYRGKKKYKIPVLSRGGQMIPGETRNLYLKLNKVYRFVKNNRVVLQIKASSTNGDVLRGKVSGRVKK